MHYVYVIECVNGAYYTGYTTDIARRYQEHLKGTIKCRYTRSFPPKNLLAVFEFDNKSDALRKEAEIKKLNQSQKRTLIESCSIPPSLAHLVMEQN